MLKMQLFFVPSLSLKIAICLYIQCTDYRPFCCQNIAKKGRQKNKIFKIVTSKYVQCSTSKNNALLANFQYRYLLKVMCVLYLPANYDFQKKTQLRRLLHPLLQK